MIIAVLKEISLHENRVAVSPESIKKFISLGFEVVIEKDAGKKSGFEDNNFAEAGAKIASSAQTACKNANIIIKINAPQKDEIRNFPDNAIVICNFSKLDEEGKKLITQKKLVCFALERIPRISRAQNMDVLSSQDNLAGYKAVLNAVSSLNSVVPMMTTSAGTIAPAKIFILGIGVAGLQAIATAKRLGAIVYASDVRPETKEQAESLGGKFVPSDEVNETLPKMNIIITIAGVAGKAPKLIKKDIIKTLAPNTLVFDMVGNVEGLNDKEIKTEKEITLISNHYLASEVAFSSSKFYANNIFNFTSLLYDKENKKIKIDMEDEIIKDTCIAFEGEARW